MSDLAVSVVVATRNRPARLERLLAALRAQDLDPSTFEIVVVDDGSTAPTAAVLDRAAQHPAPAIRRERNDSARGPASARNRGWRAARAPLIAFTDDDCRPVPGWLSAGIQGHRTSPDAIVQGLTEPDPHDRANASVLSHTICRTELGPSYETCNVFYPRAVLERLAGFDESFGPRAAGEDTDLAWRALDAGSPAVFAPDAVVYHAVDRLGLVGLFRFATRWTPCVRVLAAHPGSRTMLDHGVFWNVWHYLLWRSVLALLAPRWIRRLVLTRHLIALQGRGRGLGGGVWSVPLLLAYDAVEAGAIARGAIRYRTLVL